MKQVLIAIFLIWAPGARAESSGPPITGMQFVVAEENPRIGLVPATAPGKDASIYLDSRRAIPGTVVATTEIIHSTDFQGEKFSALQIRFTPQGAKDIQRITDVNIGLLLALVIDGNVRYVGRIMEPIYGGMLEIIEKQEYDWKPLKDEIDSKIR